MRKTVIAFALTAFATSGTVLANGLGEDGAWKFQKPGAKFVKLQSRMAEKLLDAGGPGPGNTTITLGDGSTLHVGDAVAGDKNSSSNCINCSTTSVAIEVGDSFSGTIADVGQTTQTGTNNKQANIESVAGNDSNVTQ